jgi:hypothetical protein
VDSNGAQRFVDVSGWGFENRIPPSAQAIVNVALFMVIKTQNNYAPMSWGNVSLGFLLNPSSCDNSDVFNIVSVNVGADQPFPLLAYNQPTAVNFTNAVTGFNMSFVNGTSFVPLSPNIYRCRSFGVRLSVYAVYYSTQAPGPGTMPPNRKRSLGQFPNSVVISQAAIDLTVVYDLNITDIAPNYITTNGSSQSIVTIMSDFSFFDSLQYQARFGDQVVDVSGTGEKKKTKDRRKSIFSYCYFFPVYHGGSQQTQMSSATAETMGCGECVHSCACGIEFGLKLDDRQRRLSVHQPCNYNRNERQLQFEFRLHVVG